MNNRILFGIMCIIFNAYGVPCFMQGRIKAGVWRIILGIITCDIMFVVNLIFGIFLGIKVLKMTDEEFEATKYTLASGIPA